MNPPLKYFSVQLIWYMRTSTNHTFDLTHRVAAESENEAAEAAINWATEARRGMPPIADCWVGPLVFVERLPTPKSGVLVARKAVQNALWGTV
jgi:hypothetical protein